MSRRKRARKAKISASEFFTGIFHGHLGKPTRELIRARLRQIYGDAEDSEYVIDHLEEIWDRFDWLEESFCVEDARAMINAQPESASS